MAHDFLHLSNQSQAHETKRNSLTAGDKLLARAIFLSRQFRRIDFFLLYSFSNLGDFARPALALVR
jgi:hypothetical protein